MVPFTMKVQPIESHALEEQIRFEPVKPMAKSRLKRLFERQFLRNSTAEKVGVFEEHHFRKDMAIGSSAEFEPSSDCLSLMVQDFMEESHEKQSAASAAAVAMRCSRNRCNCFKGNCSDSSEGESSIFGGFGGCRSYSGDECEILKSLVPCVSVSERNLLADTARIVDKNKICKRKDDCCRKVVTDGLLALGYDASVCKSRWDKSPSCLAGEYEYIDVIVAGERLLIDIDFRSEFEIARSTKTYKSLLQILPYIFVGKADRLQKIITVVSDAAKQSLKKKGMHIPPWRKAEYVKAKWISPYTRTTTPTRTPQEIDPKSEKVQPLVLTGTGDGGLMREEKFVNEEADPDDSVFALSSESSPEDGEKALTSIKEWKPPEIKPKTSQIGIKIVTGLASVIEDKP